MPDTTEPARLFVVRDELGKMVEVHRAASREEAIKAFCYPALMWSGFERYGWTCEEQTND